MKWISEDEEDRRSFIGNLLPHIRLGLLSVKYLKDNVMNKKFLSICSLAFCLKLSQLWMCAKLNIPIQLELSIKMLDQ
jgi:hypothetical protein